MFSVKEWGWVTGKWDVGGAGILDGCVWWKRSLPVRDSPLFTSLALSITPSSSVFAKWSLLATRKWDNCRLWSSSPSPQAFFTLAQPELTFHHRLCLSMCDGNCTGLFFTRRQSTKGLAQKKNLQDTNGTALKLLNSFWPPSLKTVLSAYNRSRPTSSVIIYDRVETAEF